MGTSLESFSPTYRTFINLQNDFEASVRQEDPLSRDKRVDIAAFLEAVLSTSVMREAHRFLHEEGVVGRNMSEFAETLQEIWFTPYARSSKYLTLDSCGFEHVFVGETKSNGRVSGFHNWIKLFSEERRGNLDYFGIVSPLEHHILSVQFQWLGHLKPVSTMFMGTSPEYELAVYTVCLLLQPNAPCRFTLDSHPVTVISSDVRHVEGLQIATAYPQLH